MFQGIQCVVQGADHIKYNKICQDAAGELVKEHYAAAAVSDGHGGSKYIRSEIGSRFAVQAALDTVSAFMEDYESFTAAIRKNPDYILNRMECYFIAKWNEKIEIHHDDHELTPEEKKIIEKENEKSGREVDWHSYYGCTVLIAVMAEGYSYGMLVGDGTFAVVYDDGTVSVPIEDPYSVANMTSSVCDKQSKDRFQHYFEDRQPLSMTVSSDGLCKSFDSEENLKDYHIRLTYMMDSEQVSLSLKKNLQNFTQKGSGDDISVAAVFDSEMLSGKKAVLLNLIEEKKRADQERRIAEKKRLEERKRQIELARREEERRREEEERRRREEELRRLEENRRQAEKRLKEEERRWKEAELRYAKEKEKLSKQKEEIERQRAELKEARRRLQEEQSARDREQRNSAEVFHGMTEYDLSPEDSQTSLTQKTLQGAAVILERIEYSTRNCIDIIGQKLEKQADIIANDGTDTKETKK